MDGPTFLCAPGETARLIEAFDWSETSLGPIERWPGSLKAIIGFMIRSPVPMVLLWGADGVMIYNDAYSVFAGVRHPELLGSKVREGWPEVAAFNDNVMRVGLAGGTLVYKDQELTLNRSGFPERIWMDLDYSPVLADDGEPGGVMAIVTETTERVLAERREAAERGRQHELLRQMPGFIGVVAGPEHVYEYVNEALIRFAGRSDFIGRKFREVFADLSAQGFAHLLDEVHSTGESVIMRGMELRLQGGGNVQFIDILLKPVRDDEGAVVGVFIGGHEVTEAYRSASALRASEARLLELNADLERRVAQRAQARGRTWQLSPDLMGALNPFGRFENSNPAWGTMLGWSETEVATSRVFDMLHPNDVERSREAFSTTLAGRPLIRFPNRLRHKDGTYRWISWVGVPEDGLVYCVGRDVTSEKEQAAALRLFENIVQSNNAPICAFDIHYRLIAFNQAHDDEFFRVQGRRTSIGDVFPDLFLPEQADVMRALMARALTGESFTVVETFGKPELGKPQWEISYTPLRDEAGEIIGAFHYAMDISARLAAEAELMAAQDALRQSQKMEAVGQLTGGLAHDFNNLLAGISGSLELMQTRISQGRLGDLDRYMAAAQGASKRAAALTHRLLAFSRRQTLDPKATDVNQLVAGIEDLIRRTVGPEITIEVVPAVGSWSVLIDPPQLENALLNLCINARDAMPEGGRITIETANKLLDQRAARERDLPAGHYLSLCVTDTGTGMPPAVTAKIFDPFFTTKPIGQGTGLGLSMIYGFVRQSGGQVRVHSEVGQGTTLCLYLPRHDGDASEADLLAERGGAPGAGRHETVLVVDDEPTVRMLVTEVLEELGYTTIEAGDGPSGLRMLQSSVRLSLLVTDVGLPGGLNGRQLADAARVTRPDLKVLFITGYAENAIIGNGHLAPGMQVLTKPFTIETLAGRIKALTKSST